ncbi:MAG TPA: ABC transporter permease [Gemmatimonadales bacterium]|nr:ABC transporter permease [Gemmatimonadales bacterium]
MPRPLASVWADSRGRTGLILLGLIVLLAAAAPGVTSFDPNAQGDVVATRFKAPLTSDGAGALHLLGTDRFGRDVWTRLVYGARVSLATGLAATAIAVVLGLLVGAAAGVWRGPVGTILLAFTDFALALPRVVLLLILAALWPPSGTLVIVVLGLTGWMSIARLVYGETQSLMARPFTSAAEALGASRPWIAWRHVVPNVWTPVIIAAALGVGNAITLEAGLSFLGLGVQPPAPSWGNMIASGRDTLINAPWVAIAPGVALVVVVVACTLVGDALRDRLAGTELPQ